MAALRLALVLLATTATLTIVRAEAAPVKLGAYYFDGWNSHVEHSPITPRLLGEFANREPQWGWQDDTLDIMEHQIDLAANAGLGFWAFDWYWAENKGDSPLNNALTLYLQAKNRARLQFCLLVANHGGFRLGPKEWPIVTARWIALFKEPGHVTVGGKPLIIFFSPPELIKSFGSPAAAKAALDQLRADAKKAGLPGVTIAACTFGNDLAVLRTCGFDVFTGYNYHEHPMGTHVVPGSKQQPFAALMTGSEEMWNQIGAQGGLPYLPVVTTGWDKRPWETVDALDNKRDYFYADRSPVQVQQFVRDGISWLNTHANQTVPERIIMLYAWNENAEGGYLTPTKVEGSNYLDAVSRALRSR